jgi:thioredoxin 1
MSENLTALTDDAFQTEVLDASKPTLIDFWASWCAPCKALTPMVEELAGQYHEQVTFRKMNIDENPSTPMKMGVRGVPTLILFKDGQAIDQIVGIVSKDKLETFVKKAL